LHPPSNPLNRKNWSGKQTFFVQDPLDIKKWRSSVNALNGAGDTKKPMYATLVSMVMIQIPLGYFLSQHFGLGVTGNWIAVIVGIIVQAVLLGMMYRSGSRKRIAM
jgi:Na+-driven multidrug efflux pump